MPPSKIKHNRHIIALSLILANMLFLSACLDGSTRRTPPKAVKGGLDLTDWDFKKDGPVDLSGEYEFYWSQHLLPSDFTKAIAPRKTGFIGVPSYWKNKTYDGQKLPGDGYVTYRLKIALNKQPDRLGLKLVEISNAYNIYVNGEKVAALGQAGTNRATTVPREFPRIVDFEIKTNQIELIIQVSNFHHRRGGAWSAIQMGRELDLREAQKIRLSFDMFLFGSIFIMALYHLGLFTVRKTDPSALYFSIFCFLIALRLLSTGGRHLLLLFPQASWELMYKFAYCSFYLSVPAFGMFMQSLFRNFPNGSWI